MQHFESINEFNKYLNLGDSKHPLIDIRRYSDVISLMPKNSKAVKFSFYKIAIKKNFKGLMEYGKTKYDSTKRIMYFIEPGQFFSWNSTEPWNGYQIFLHPDIFKN